MTIQDGIHRLLCSLTALALLALPLISEARTITDMTGRKVQVPDRITRVYASSPPATYLLYALDPALIVGLNFPLNETEERFLKPADSRFRTAVRRSAAFMITTKQCVLPEQGRQLIST